MHDKPLFPRPTIKFKGITKGFVYKEGGHINLLSFFVAYLFIKKLNWVNKVSLGINQIVCLFLRFGPKCNINALQKKVLCIV